MDYSKGGKACPLANKKCEENMVKQIKFVLLAKSTPLNDDLRI